MVRCDTSRVVIRGFNQARGLARLNIIPTGLENGPSVWERPHASTTLPAAIKKPTIAVTTAIDPMATAPS